MSFVDRDSSIKQRFIETNGVTLNVVEQGEGPAVLFVHGFPDGWRGWRRQMKAVADAGYRAIAFDMRGYGESSKPADPALYTVFSSAISSAYSQNSGSSAPPSSVMTSVRRSVGMQR